jgi:hypothetical protein
MAILLGLCKLFFKQIPWAGFGLYRKNQTKVYLPVFACTIVLVSAQILLTHVFTDILFLILIWILSISIMFKIVGTIMIAIRRIKKFAARLGCAAIFLGLFRLTMLNSEIEWLLTTVALAMMFGAYYFLMKYHFSKPKKMTEKEIKKDIFGYCLYISGLLVLVASVPVLITVNATFSYHIERFSDIESQRLNQHIVQNKQDQLNYFSLIGTKIEPKKPQVEPFFYKNTNTDNKRLLWIIELINKKEVKKLRNSDIDVSSDIAQNQEPLLHALYAMQSLI